jgi:predicted HTH transcriptional regulator
MIDLQTIEDLSLLRESIDLECKAAQGADGQGEVPKDFWPTYSAMANAHGGVVLLGLTEKSGVFSVAGLANVAKVRADLFNNLNNSGKVSCNLLTDIDVQEVLLEGKTILVVSIPQASRKQRPVFLNGQPLGNTYRRLNDGDRKCDDETVKRMLAEQIEDERDARILSGFGMDDVDTDSLRIYRQMLKDEKPSHPYLEQNDEEFLFSLRAMRRDRQTGISGLTLGGLLMFGKWASIQEAAPHYFVDYQERPEAKTELRWVDRLVPDGTWTGNLFEFYRKVYRKLVADLKVPFALKDGQRQDDTPVHEALREALVNALVHADYTGRLSVLVVKRPDMFGFRNPGRLRLPIEQVIRGGESDCRNRVLHQMFLLIGLGERGGSGMPKIYSGWKSEGWRPPALTEKDEPEQTLLSLQMADLLPDQVVNELRARFGRQFDDLDQTGRLVMATAAIERVVSHTRLLEICGAHAHDLSLLLARLVKQQLLASEGRSRGTVYFLPGQELPTPEQVFVGPTLYFEPSLNVGSSLEHSDETFEYSDQLNIGVSDGPRDNFGRLLSEHLDVPVVDDLAHLSPDFLDKLVIIGEQPRKGRIRSNEMEQVILALCKGQYLAISVLSALLNRNPDALRQQHIRRLVQANKLVLAFPTKPTHEKQAYKTAEAS